MERYWSSWRNDERRRYVHAQHLPLVPEDEEVFHRPQHPVQVRRLRSPIGPGAGTDRTGDEEKGWSAFVSLGAHRRRSGRRLEPCEIRRALGIEQDELAMDVEARKRSLRYFFAKIVEPLGYKFTPDEELADFLLEQETHLEEAHGSPFCPCQGRTQNHEQNMQIVCPCIPFHRDHFDYMKRCWCGLFVHKDVTDPDSLPQIPYTDFRKAQDAGRSGEGG